MRANTTRITLRHHAQPIRFVDGGRLCNHLAWIVDAGLPAYFHLSQPALKCGQALLSLVCILGTQQRGNTRDGGWVSDGNRQPLIPQPRLDTSAETIGAANGSRWRI